MRVITRPDFDGVVCAVLLSDALDIHRPVEWVEPNEMQKGSVEVRPDDIIANLPYHPNCFLWFDHHYTNRIDEPFHGVFRIAPSAARIVFDFYRHHLKGSYEQLIDAADKIDSASLTLDEVLHPEQNMYVLLSMTIIGRNKKDRPYWDRLVGLLHKHDMDQICADSEVHHRFQLALEQNRSYKAHLKACTVCKRHVSITDFRSFDEAPTGNRFLVFSLFPDSAVNIKIHRDSEDKHYVVVHVGHSIFNHECRVNVGLMLSLFGGGGHRGAGGTRFKADEADQVITELTDILLKNDYNEENQEVQSRD